MGWRILFRCIYGNWLKVLKIKSKKSGIKKNIKGNLPILGETKNE
jgi:hypothetical protein